MSLVPAKCPECGGNINIDPDKKAAICEYCRQPFIVQEAINIFNSTYIITNNVTNEIKTESINVFESKTKVENLLKRAKQLEEDRKWEQALEYCEQALASDPDNDTAKQIAEECEYMKAQEAGCFEFGICPGCRKMTSLLTSSCKTKTCPNYKKMIFKNPYDRNAGFMDGIYHMSYEEVKSALEKK